MAAPLWNNLPIKDSDLPHLRRELADAERYAAHAVSQIARAYYADIAKRLGEALAQYEQQEAA